jgi:hypothetical protein
MTHRLLFFTLLAATVGLACPGCIASAETKTHVGSVGQQLKDLDEAYHRGIITEKEYTRLKKAIIRNND